MGVWSRHVGQCMTMGVWWCGILLLRAGHDCSHLSLPLVAFLMESVDGRENRGLASAVCARGDASKVLVMWIITYAMLVGLAHMIIILPECRGDNVASGVVQGWKGWNRGSSDGKKVVQGNPLWFVVILGLCSRLLYTPLPDLDM